MAPTPARTQDEEDERELLLRLLPMSASLAGLSVGAITLYRLTDMAVRLSTFADDLVAICAALFLLSTYLIFWALRSHALGRTRWLARLVDGVFLVALTALVGVGFMLSTRCSDAHGFRQATVAGRQPAAGWPGAMSLGTEQGSRLAIPPRARQLRRAPGPA